MSGLRPLKPKIGAFVESLRILCGRLILNAQKLMCFMSARCLGLFALVVCTSGVSHGYTTVIVSTGTPVGLEDQFISAVSAEFNVRVVKNPLASGVYTMTLYGPNTNYAPPLTATQLLQQINLDAQYMANVDKDSYPTGWGDGESYQQFVTSNMIQNFMVQCSTPSVFVNATIDTTTWSSDQCQEVLNAALQQNFNLSLSTPTIVPGGFQ